MSLLLLREYFGPFTSATVHIINHTRNTISPNVTIYDDVLNTQLVPVSIEVISSTQIQVTLFVARPIRGTIQ